MAGLVAGALETGAEILCDNALFRRLRNLPVKDHADSLAAEERALDAEIALWLQRYLSTKREFIL